MRLRTRRKAGSHRRPNQQAAIIGTMLGHHAQSTRTVDGSVVNGRLVETELDYGSNKMKRFALESADGLVTLHLSCDDSDCPTLRALIGSYCEAVGTLRVSPFSMSLTALKVYEQEPETI